MSFGGVQTALDASFSISLLNWCCYPESVGGAGVGIWRDEVNNLLYIATAAHVLEPWWDDGCYELVLVDSKNRRYSECEYDIWVVIFDRTYDVAVLVIYDGPTDVPVIQLNPTLSNVKKGDRTFTIGWPELLDSLSVSDGVVRSDKWNINGMMNQTLVSDPAYGGNSGGAVLSSEGRCVGLVSYAIVDGETDYSADTMIGIIPTNVLYQALLFIIYRPHLTWCDNALTYTEDYWAGILGMRVDPFLKSYLNGDMDWCGIPDSIRNAGSCGLIPLDVACGSPADCAGLFGITNYPTIDGDESMPIIWAMRRYCGDEWIPLTEENSWDSILRTFYADQIPKGRKILNTLAPWGNPLDIDIDYCLTIELLVTWWTDGYFDYNDVVYIHLRRRGWRADDVNYDYGNVGQDTYLSTVLKNRTTTPLAKGQKLASYIRSLFPKEYVESVSVEAKAAAKAKYQKVFDKFQEKQTKAVDKVKAKLLAKKKTVQMTVPKKVQLEADAKEAAKANSKAAKIAAKVPAGTKLENNPFYPANKEKAAARLAKLAAAKAAVAPPS
jgi:S1-C subfamily serine protease